MLQQKNHSISKLTGMFWDKALEQEYQESYLSRSSNHLRKIVLTVGILFFLFFIYDFALNGSFQVIAVLFLCRLAFLLLSLLLYIKSTYFLRALAFLKITLYELTAVVSFFIIIISYEEPHFVLQAFAINVIVLAIFFLIPNLHYNKLILSSFTFLVFLVISLLIYQPPILEVMGMFCYLFLVILFSSISSYSLDKYRRLDFANKQYFVELSMKDPLTNIYNRMKFNESLSGAVELAHRYGNTFSLIMFDIDHFKQLNDAYGHIFGDRVLVDIANLVKDSIREVDIFARWGGEEFVILLPETNCKEASALAERLRKTIHKQSLNKEILLTCSFGVTCLTPKDDEDSIMNRVDIALYRAKNSGRNTVITESDPQALSV